MTNTVALIFGAMRQKMSRRDATIRKDSVPKPVGFSLPGGIGKRANKFRPSPGNGRGVVTHNLDQLHLAVPTEELEHQLRQAGQIQRIGLPSRVLRSAGNFPCKCWR